MIWVTQVGGCYRGEVQTPNLDRLAESGIRYTQSLQHIQMLDYPDQSELTGLYHHRSNRDLTMSALIGEGNPQTSRGAEPGGHR